MSNLVFVDTNVLLYEWDASTPEKQRRCVDWMKVLWSERTGRLSFQVLTEFFVTATRKLKPPLEPSQAQGYARTLFAWEPVATDADILVSAWKAQERYRLSWWDALIVAAADRAGCQRLLSEDFQDGQQIGDLVVVNPFTANPGERPVAGSRVRSR